MHAKLPSTERTSFCCPRSPPHWGCTTSHYTSMPLYLPRLRMYCYRENSRVATNERHNYRNMWSWWYWSAERCFMVALCAFTPVEYVVWLNYCTTQLCSGHRMMMYLICALVNVLAAPQLKIHQSQPNIYTLFWRFDLIRRSWCCILLSLDATIRGPCF